MCIQQMFIFLVSILGENEEGIQLIKVVDYGAHINKNHM